MILGIKFTLLFEILKAKHAGQRVEMGHIREITLKKGETRFQADINLNGHPRLTAVPDRRLASV